MISDYPNYYNYHHLYLKALIEMCAGNYKNQEVVFKGQIVESINTILQHLFVEHQASPAPPPSLNFVSLQPTHSFISTSVYPCIIFLSVFKGRRRVCY